LKAGRYWPRLRRMTVWLLVIWFLLTFGLTYFARELSFFVLGWPFSFWVAAQGGLLAYLVLIAFYAWYANRLDAACGIEDPPDPDEAEER